MAAEEPVTRRGSIPHATKMGLKPGSVVLENPRGERHLEYCRDEFLAHDEKFRVKIRQRDQLIACLRRLARLKNDLSARPAQHERGSRAWRLVPACLVMFFIYGDVLPPKHSAGHADFPLHHDGL